MTKAFQAAKKFEGQRLRMEFKKGDQGFCYYPMRLAIISLATELAILETFHDLVKLELDKLFPTFTTYTSRLLPLIGRR